LKVIPDPDQESRKTALTLWIPAFYLFSGSPLPPSAYRDLFLENEGESFEVENSSPFARGGAPKGRRGSGKKQLR
jgi:hypothetical protein